MRIAEEELPNFPQSRILGWAADEEGCGFYRLRLPLEALRDLGHEVFVAGGLNQSQINYSNVFIGQRVCLEGPTKVWQQVAQQANRPKMVFEIDDDLFNIDPSNEVAYKFFSSEKVQQRLIDNALVADLVTVSTPALAQVMAKLGCKSVVPLPNTIPQEVLTWERPGRFGVKCTVGWAGSQTHAMDWELAALPLGKFMWKNKGAFLHTIGYNYAQKLMLPEDRFQHSMWAKPVPRYWQMIDFDIGLAPLKPHVFNDSKSHIKALEYAALGIPIIASNTGPYKSFVVHGETGFLVDKPNEWYEYLELLYNDTELRHKMGINARAHAALWTTERWAPVWEGALLK